MFCYSDRKYPDYYYTIKFTIPDSNMTLEFLMIDTMILCGHTDDAIDLAPTGPTSVGAAKKHWRWIRKHLEHST